MGQPKQGISFFPTATRSRAPLHKRLGVVAQEHLQVLCDLVLALLVFEHRHNVLGQHLVKRPLNLLELDLDLLLWCTVLVSR